MTLVAMITQLRRQQTLDTEISSVCPKASTIRWHAMFLATFLITEHRHEIMVHYAEMPSARRPSDPTSFVWWIICPVTVSIKSTSTQCDAASSAPPDAQPTRAYCAAINLKPDAHHRHDEPDWQVSRPGNQPARHPIRLRGRVLQNFCLCLRTRSFRIRRARISSTTPLH